MFVARLPESTNPFVLALFSGPRVESDTAYREKRLLVPHLRPYKEAKERGEPATIAEDSFRASDVASEVQTPENRGSSEGCRQVSELTTCRDATVCLGHVEPGEGGMMRTDLKESKELNVIGVEPERASPCHAKHENDHDNGHKLTWRDINRVLFLAAAAGAVGSLRGASSPYIGVTGVACILVGGFPIFHEAYENVFRRRMMIELLMTIAIVAALAILGVFTALIMTLFVLVGEMLEGLTVGRGR
jgi:cation transport ATPase